MAMKVTVPPRLQPGDTVRVVAPARSRAFVAEHDHSNLITARFDEMGLRLTFGAHVDERDEFDSCSVASRVADLHDAFADPGVAGVLSVIGGFNSNELLPYLDWDLIASHPKVFCGYSDITALQNAMLARSGLVTYSGPHWSTFGMREHFEPTGEWFRHALFTDADISLRPAEYWTDDPWFVDQDHRTLRPTEGWWPLSFGQARGRAVGGNLSTISLLQGTEYMPPLGGAVLFLEDDAVSDVPTFCRHLTSLLQLPDAAGVEGLVIGRFQVGSGMTRSLLTRIIERQPALSGRPVLANVDFGHTNPIATIPIGGTADLRVGPTSGLTLAQS